MAFRRVIVSEYFHGTDDRYAWCVGGDDHHALLTMSVGVCWVGLSHEEMDACARVASAGYPPGISLDQ